MNYDAHIIQEQWQQSDIFYECIVFLTFFNIKNVICYLNFGVLFQYLVFLVLSYFVFLKMFSAVFYTTLIVVHNLVANTRIRP
jgi:hypothetical protein